MPMSPRFFRSRRRRMALWRAQHGQCALCHEPLDPQQMDIDHKEPWIKTGRTNFYELQAAHPHCNRRKGAR
jgi:5-methylcytosine-specific restriction endonuclease McrA